MSDFKLRAEGTPPYNGVAKNFNGHTIHTITNVLSDQIEIPDSVMSSLSGGIDISITDANGKEGFIRYDNGTLFAMRESLIGFSVSNGDWANHVAKITEGNQRGFNFCGVMVESADFKNDAQLVAVENAGVFDASAPLPSNPIFSFDRTVKTLMSQSICNKIRVNWWWKRGVLDENNGSTITAFINKSDAQMRPDGVTPIVREEPVQPGGPNFNVIIPSYAAPNTLKMAKRFMLMFYKRYLPYINSGNIIAIGSVTVTSGEGEMSSVYMQRETLENHMGQGYSHGDFSPYSMAIFRAKYPQYASKTNNEIATSSGDLQLKWTNHNNDIIINFEHSLTTYINQNVPGLKRVKHLQQDSGSFVDHQAYFRRTLKSSRRATHPSAFLFKSNDNSNLPQDTVAFYLDHLTSLARRAGGIAICEPSPPNYEDSQNNGYLTHEIKEAYARGADISYYTPNGTIASNLTDMAGIQKGGLRKGKNEYKIINGQKRLIKHRVNDSDILINGGFGQNGAWKNSWAQFKATHGLQHVDTTSIDDVN